MKNDRTSDRMPNYQLTVHQLRAIQTITFKSSEEASTSYTMVLISIGFRSGNGNKKATI